MVMKMELVAVIMFLVVRKGWLKCGGEGKVMVEREKKSGR